jgi:hypothetical protein
MERALKHLKFLEVNQISCKIEEREIQDEREKRRRGQKKVMLASSRRSNTCSFSQMLARTTLVLLTIRKL